MLRLPLIAAVCALAAVSHGAEADTAKLPPPASGQIDFERQIRPLFEAKCFKCHGEEKQKSGLRLDEKEAAMRGGDNYAPAIIPGKSAESPLVQFSAGLDEELLMPPAKSDLKPMTREEIALLRAWIDQGAVWPAKTVAADEREKHWAFQPVRRPAAPEGAAAIDHFLAAKLKEQGLAFSPPADRRTLIRRVYFDLIGLPPAPEEIEAFVRDADPQAYEKLVDKLLASPRHGERWAAHWLDVVRFAESNGFETNGPRPTAWPYRDYVIRSFNDDKPFDRFIKEQLAGDALGADEATGFIVAGSRDIVKSPDPVLTAQQRADELHDMVSTTGSAFLGLTIGCARCHNHKFDPISQVDYYAVKACFAGVQHGERAPRPADDTERQKRIKKLEGELAPIASALREFQPIAYPGRTVLLDETAPQNEELIPARSSAPHLAGKERGFADDPGDAFRFPNLGKAYQWWKTLENKDVFAWAPKLSGRWRVWVSWGCGPRTHAQAATYVLDADGDPATAGDQVILGMVDQRKFADGATPSTDKPLWSGFYFVGELPFTPATRIFLRTDQTGAPVTADVLVLEEINAQTPPMSEGRLPVPHLRPMISRGENLDRFAPIEAKFLRFEAVETTQLEPCIDELEVFTGGENARNVALASAGTKATASGTYPNSPIHRLEHLTDGKYGNEWSWISNTRGKGWVQLEFAKPERIERVAWSRDRDKVPRYNDRLATRYTIQTSLDGERWTTVATSEDRLPYGSEKKGAEALQFPPAQLSEAERGAYEGLAARQAKIAGAIAKEQDLPKIYAGKFGPAEKTFRFQRGDATQPKEEVPAGALASLGGPWRLALETPDQERRLALAKWVASPENPLTARVLANRLWQHHFGSGIVETPSDFGLAGARPTHPELLDWLASEVIAHGWSMKHLHRLICTSAGYRQASAPNPAAMKLDAGARLLWRFPPRRLEAEPLRDAILAVTNKLDLKVGGPGFDLFEPNTNYVKVYVPKAEPGPDTWRRMIYQSKPRMQLDDVFGTFDCPDAGQVSPKRNVSTTPLQALSMMNSTFLLQQAGFLAERLAKSGEVEAQVQGGFALAFGREATAEEIAAGARLVNEHGLPAFCRALFNASEFLWVY